MRNLVIGISCWDKQEKATVEKIIDFKKVIIRHSTTGELFVREITALDFEDTPIINNSSIDEIEDEYWQFLIENQPALSNEEERELMKRINQGCDLIKKMGLTPSIPQIEND